MTDWTKPVEVTERGILLATIAKDGDRYTVVNFDKRVSSEVSTFKDADVMRKWLEWAYPNANALMQGDEVLKVV